MLVQTLCEQIEWFGFLGCGRTSIVNKQLKTKIYVKTMNFISFVGDIEVIFTQGPVPDADASGE